MRESQLCVSETHELKVVFLSPRRRDGEVTSQILAQKGFACLPCHSMDELKQRVLVEAGVLVMTEGVMTKPFLAELVSVLEQQPDWSDLPVVLIISPNHMQQFASLALRRSFTVLNRPIHLPTFLSVIQSALESRRRQYQIRDLLKELQTLNSNLEDRFTQLQRLSLELSQAEHRERRRLATDLHDYLAQLLVVCRMKIGQGFKSNMNADTADLLRNVDLMLEESLTYTRSLIADLSPRVLYEFGLPRALQWLGGQMGKYGLHVEVHKSVESIHMAEDIAILVFQTVRELLMNVTKHAEVEEATVSLAMPTSEQIEISVEDHGRGFEPEINKDLAKFGLLSVQERIQAIAGQFTIKSTPGKGTRATIRVPLHERREQRVSPTNATTTTTTTTKKKGGEDTDIVNVLLVDDMAMVREGLRTVLQNYPNVSVVAEAENGQEAVELARKLHPDVIIMDVNMPKLNGIDATRQIVRESSAVKVIGLTVNDEKEMCESMLKAGAVDYLKKDRAADELYEAICSACPKE